jgi:hypothetical protein
VTGFSECTCCGEAFPPVGRPGWAPILTIHKAGIDGCYCFYDPGDWRHGLVFHLRRAIQLAGTGVKWDAGTGRWTGHRAGTLEEGEPL